MQTGLQNQSLWVRLLRSVPRGIKLSGKLPRLHRGLRSSSLRFSTTSLSFKGRTRGCYPWNQGSNPCGEASIFKLEVNCVVANDASSVRF